MEQQPKNEYRDNLAKKLKGARELDKDLAEQYQEKVEGTEEYQNARTEKIENFKASKTEQQVKEEEKIKQNKINALKEEIDNIIPKAKENVVDKNSFNISIAIEKAGSFEEAFCSKLKVLIENSESIEDKKAYYELFERFESIKNGIKELRARFASQTNFSPTKENMIKYRDKWNPNQEIVRPGDRSISSTPPKGLGEYIDANAMDDLLNADGKSYFGTFKISLKELNNTQKTKLLESLGFSRGASMGDVIEEYNKNQKPFLKRKVKFMDDHKVEINTNQKGILVDSWRSKNYYDQRLALGKEAIDEFFKENI